MKSKNRIWIVPFMIMAILAVTSRCKKENTPIAPTLTTSVLTSITLTTALSGGEVTSDGGSSVTARGVCWSTGATPTVDDNKTADGSGKGIFTSSLTGLSANTTYNVRAYATNAAGTGYGNAISFTTLQAPALTTTAMTGITQFEAISGGNVTSEGSSAVTARGVCWGTGATPTIADSKTTNGSGTGIFISNLSGLSTNTAYNVRAYATNDAGTSYGNAISFTTLDVPTILLKSGGEFIQNWTNSSATEQYATGVAGKTTVATFSSDVATGGIALYQGTTLVNSWTSTKGFTLGVVLADANSKIVLTGVSFNSGNSHFNTFGLLYAVSTGYDPIVEGKKRLAELQSANGSLWSVMIHADGTFENIVGNP